jgi:hypothetical protein
LGYQGADDRPPCVGMGLVEAHFHAGSTHDTADEPRLELDLAEYVAVPPEIVCGIIAGRDLRHRAVDDRPRWANEHQSANRPQTRPEKPGEPGVGVEAALDHVSCAAGQIGSQVLDGLAFAAEQQHFVRRRIVAIGADDREAVFPGDRLGEHRVDLRTSQKAGDCTRAVEGARFSGPPSRLRDGEQRARGAVSPP